MKLKRKLVWIIVFLAFPAGAMAQSLQRADSLRVKGEDFHERGNFKHAQDYYEKAFELYKTHHDTASLLITGVYLGEVLVQQSQMERAIDLFNHLKSVPHPANDDSLKARIESDLGWTYKQLGDLEKAQNHLESCLTYAYAAKDSLLIGIGLNNLASIYSRRDEPQKALSHYQKALAISEKLDNKRSQAFILSHIGLIHEGLALYDQALDYYLRSLEIAEQLNNINLLSSIYDKIGGLKKKIGNYNQALIHLEKSLNYLRKANNIQKIGSTLNEIGILYSELGNAEKALEYYRESLKLWEKASNPNELSTAYGNIAHKLWDLGEREEAIQYFERALVLRKNGGQLSKIASSLFDLANVEISQGNFSDAKSYIDQGRDIVESIADKSLKIESFFLMGRYDYSRGDYSNAITHYKKALNFSRSNKNSAHLPSVKLLAYSYNQLQSDSALYYGRQAIEIIEQERSQTGPLSEFKSGYFKQHADFYKSMAAWQLEYNNDLPKAYQYVQMAKTRSLNDELAAASQRIDESLPEDVRIRRGQMLSEISALYQQLKETTAPGKEAALRDSIRQKELSYASFENRLQEQHPKYKQFQSPEPVTVAQVQQMCDNQTAVIEYAVTDKSLLIFLITRDHVRARQLSLKNAANPNAGLSEHIMEFRDAILRRAPEDSIHALSEPVYEKLIKPLEKELAGFENLLIVPDGYLAYLPVEALSKDNNYLVSQYNIKYAPSMSGFSLIKSDAHTPERLLAIANANSSSRNSEMPMLPTADLEIQSLSKLFPRHTLLNDKKATEAKVKNELQQPYSNIHIAAHSMIDEQHSFLSGIMLAGEHPETELGTDSYLRTSEIYRLSIPANMVVLSACKSGMGNLISGEGMLGLQRAFFSAGVSTVVVSLWDVYDRPTTKLMQRFYSSLVNGSGQSWSNQWDSFQQWIGWDDSIPFGQSATSIRKAKLAMLDSPEYHHPVYWAPFVVVGR